MRVPVRMVGIAASVFWIFLIIFSVSALYSVKDVRLKFGEPRCSLSPDNEMLFSLPVAVVNEGYYDLGYFNVSTGIAGGQNQMIAQGFTFLPVVSKGEAVNITHQMRVNLASLLQTHQSLLFNDTELQVSATVSMRAAGVIPIQISSNLSMPWGAPMYNFTLGTPEFVTDFELNPTAHYRVVVPISFENHAFFGLTGTVHMLMHNSTNAFIGEGQVAIEALQSSVYHGSLELYIPANVATRNGHFEVYFATSLFNNGPLVVPYGA